ncbi:MAG: hypothetical protein AABO58_25125 [Acidobacteriota bacterium]
MMTMRSKGLAVLLAVGTFVISSGAFAQTTQDYRGFIGIANATPGQRLSVGGNLEVADVAPGAVELSRNGVDWPSSGGGIADQWSTWSWTGAGGSVSFVTSIVTGNGFTGNAQRVVYNTVTGTTGGKLTQALTFLKDHQYRISFKYRSNYTFQVVLGDNEGGGVLPANPNNAVAVTLFASPLIQDRPALDFYSPGGGAVPAAGAWFEIDEVSVKEATVGNAMVRGLFTGGGANGIKVDLAGNVGLGGDPFHKLDVAGNMTVGAGYRTVTTVPVDGMIVQGNVGIGTPNPATPLDVNGATTLRSTLAVTGSANFANPTSSTSRVGIGVTNPAAKLDISDSTGSPRILLSGKDAYTGTSSTDGIAFLLGLNVTNNRQLWIADSAYLSNPANPLFRLMWNPAFVELGVITGDGNSPRPMILNGNNSGLSMVGIGTFYPDPTAKLHVQGKLRLGANGSNTDLVVFTDTAGSLNGTAYDQINSIMPVTIPASGTTRTALHLKNAVGAGTNQIDLVVDGNIAAKYQDVAEWVPATVTMPAGTVVVLNGAKSNEVMPSARSYDTSVAGVVSAQPGLLLGEAGASKAMIATTGRVKIRVDATSRPIAIGDLLVTSDRSGLAMRSEPIDVGGVKIHRPGTLIGKALEPLEGGVGEILVLLSLQ